MITSDRQECLSYFVSSPIIMPTVKMLKSVDQAIDFEIALSPDPNCAAIELIIIAVGMADWRIKTFLGSPESPTSVTIPQPSSGETINRIAQGARTGFGL